MMSTTSKSNIKMIKPIGLRKSKNNPTLWKPSKHAKGRAVDVHHLEKEHTDDEAAGAKAEKAPKVER